jgi:hypothetical protein
MRPPSEYRDRCHEQRVIAARSDPSSDKLTDGRWVTDYYVATPSNTLQQAGTALLVLLAGATGRIALALDAVGGSRLRCLRI